MFFDLWSKIFIVIFLIFSTLGQNVQENTQLKGGLVFKPEDLAQINQDYIKFIRSVDTSTLRTFAQLRYKASKVGYALKIPLLYKKRTLV